jgi:hypothetical protein
VSTGNDSFWRRPAGVEGSLEPVPEQASPPVGEYVGPPRTAAPPHGWRPPQVTQPAPPRALPEQDLDRIDREEQAAKTLTTGVAMIAGAVMVALLLVLCARALF